MSKSRQFIIPIQLLSLIVVLSASTILPIRAQQADPKVQRPRQVFPRQEPDDVVKIDTDLVSLDVLATDTEGISMCTR